MYLTMILESNNKLRKTLLYSLIIPLILNSCLSVNQNETSLKSENENTLENYDIDSSVDIDSSMNDIRAKEEEPQDIRTYFLEDIIETINKIIGNYKDNVAIYYYNFNTEEQYYVNENVKFLSASLKKLPQVMEILDKVHNGEITLETKIEYNYDVDYAEGTGILQFEEVIGARKIKELVELSILESDNIAYNMLKRFCNDDLVKYIRNLTGDNSIVDEEYIKLTAKNNFDILYKLYTNPNNNPYYKYLIDLMKKTAFHDRLDKYLPYEEVAHKIGSYYRYYHDAGIIFGKEVYILVILSKDIGELTDSSEFSPDDEERYVIDMGKEACELIANISKEIYDIVSEVPFKEYKEYPY